MDETVDEKKIEVIVVSPDPNVGAALVLEISQMCKASSVTASYDLGDESKITVEVGESLKKLTREHAVHIRPLNPTSSYASALLAALRGQKDAEYRLRWFKGRVKEMTSHPDESVRETAKDIWEELNK